MTLEAADGSDDVSSLPIPTPPRIPPPRVKRSPPLTDKPRNGLSSSSPSQPKGRDPAWMLLPPELAAGEWKYPNDFKEDFLSVYETINMNRLVGSSLITVSSEDFILPTKYSRGVLTTSEICVLEKLYFKLSSSHSSTCIVNSIFLKYSSVTINGKYFRSAGKQSNVPVVILASWDENLYGSTPTPQPRSSLLPPTSILRPVNVHYFTNVSFCAAIYNTSFLFAYV